MLGLAFTVAPSGVDETLRAGEPQESAAVRLATTKAQAREPRPGEIVIAADTLVVLNDGILGKPTTAVQATEMLRSLRDREHRVVTGVAVAKGGEVTSGSRVTRVRMRPYTDDDIARYVASGEPLDKAGGYAIQDPILRPAAGVDGCYCNVVGLPLGLLRSMLQTAGYPAGRMRPLDRCAGCPDWPAHD